MKLENVKYQSKYTLEFTTIDGISHKKQFVWWQEKLLSGWLRPQGERGVNFIEGGKLHFIPWHQIKRSSCEEEIIGEEAR